MWSVCGHLHSIEHLERGLASGRLAHAMLFTGPAGIGKTALAIDLARAANCVGSDPPCQTCVHCRQITGQTHPDVTVIERESGRESIQIESVRELRDAASLRPFQGRKKVYIIAGAENLSAQAADALLKTLEEPQPQVMIILTAPDEAALPDTVVSRCQVLEMQPVDTETVLQALRNAGEPAADSERIARLAMGRVGWALKAAKQPKLVTQQEAAVETLSQVLDLDLAARLTLAETLTADRKERAAVRRTIELLLLICRDLLLLGNGLEAGLVSDAQAERLRFHAGRMGRASVISLVDSLRTAMERIDQNVDPRLALEAFLVNAP